MIKKNLTNTDSSSIDPTQEITDNTIALRFKEANAMCQAEEATKIFDIVQHTKESYVHFSNAPTEYVIKQIQNSIENQEVVHQKLLESDYLESPWSKFLFNLKSFFIHKDIVYKNVSGPLMSVDWKYFSIFSKEWKRQTTNYINDFYSYTELTFKNVEKFKNILQIEIWLFVSAIFMSGIIFFWNGNINEINNKSSAITSFLYNWKLSIFSITILGCFLLVMPYILLMTMWFININHIYRSKNFHYFLISLMTLAYIIFFTAIFNLFLCQYISWKYALE